MPTKFWFVASIKFSVMGIDGRLEVIQKLWFNFDFKEREKWATVTWFGTGTVPRAAPWWRTVTTGVVPLDSTAAGVPPTGLKSDTRPIKDS